MPRLAASLRSVRPQDSVRRAGQLLDRSFEALVLEEPLYFETWELLRRELPKSSAVALRLFTPYPRRVRMGEPSPFRLGSTDAAERRQALEQAVSTLEAADAIGARHVLVPPVRLEGPGLVHSFVDPALERSDRRAVRTDAAVRRCFDSFLSTLSHLLDRAGRYAVTLCLTPTNRSGELPLAAELEAALAEFRGAPLGVWLDTARWPRTFLALPETAGESEAAKEHALHAAPVLDGLAAGAAIRDAVGDAEGLVPGRGAVNWDLLDPALRRSSTWVLDLDARATLDEVDAARVFLERRTGKAGTQHDAGILF